MPNPDDNNNPVKKKQKEGKEFAQENETTQKGGINLESNYKSKSNGPVSINMETENESRAIGNQMSKSTSDMSGDSLATKEEAVSKPQSNSGSKMNNNSSGNLSEDPTLLNKTKSNSESLSSGSMSGPKISDPKAPKAEMPKVDVSGASMLNESPKETAESGTDTSKEKVPSAKESKEADPEKKEKENAAPKFAVSGELKKILEVLNEKPKEEEGKVSTDSADEEGAKKVAEVQNDIAAQKNLDSTVENVNGVSTGTGATSGSAQTENKETSTEEGTENDPKAAALTAFEVKETAEEEAEDVEVNAAKNEGKNHGLMVGRSIGYGAMIVPGEDEKLSISKFSETGDPVEEEAAKDKYNSDNEQIAKNMEEFGSEEVPESGVASDPKKGYYDAYIQGYNEGHREGASLKAEAAVAERTATMKAEQGTDEYTAGASLGMLCGILKAKGETEVDTTFLMKKDGKLITVPVKTTVAELDSAAFDNKQTPGGELSGAAYEKAFLLHYNMGYREGQNQRTQPPPMDDDYKLGYEQGYKLGSQKGNGATGDEDLLKIEAAYDAKDEKTLKKEELQQYRGFYAGYNKGYRQVQEAKKNKAEAEREAKNKNPNFIAGYSTGNLKGFLTAMIEPSGIDLLTALENPAKMEEAGVPDYFPIPPELRDSIKATIRFGEVEESDSEKDPMKGLLAKPLFKEGLLFGYNRGYGQGQKSRAAFKRDKHKMHPDYQRSVWVLMPDATAEYTGPVGDGNYVKGFTMGQILANAQFELNELTGKASRSEEEEKRVADLTKVMTGLNGMIGKESSYYQSGVTEFYNWWMGVLAKRAQTDKAKYGYSGEEGSDKRAGFVWGMEVGAKVIEGKEKLKEINRKGRDIKARSAELNAAIKKSEVAAKATSKSKGGEDYYIGYRNGYNHAFRVAKEGKKSDKGNLGTEELQEKVNKGELVDFNEISKAIEGLGLSANGLKKSIESATGSLKSETNKAFKDGLARGYNAGYSSTVIDVKTGKVVPQKEDKEHITDQYKTYKKIKSTGGNVALGMLYYFILGYQFHNENIRNPKFGRPKGVADGTSFNNGYQDGKEAAEPGNLKGGDSKPNKKEAVSKHLYEEGFLAAKYKAQYDNFKGKMIQAVKSEHKEEVQGTAITDSKDGGTESAGNVKGAPEKTESTEASKQNVDLSLTNGLELMENPKDQEEANLKHGKYYGHGFDDAERLWTKIIYMRKGVKLEGADVNGDVYVNLLGTGESTDKTVVEILKNDAEGEDKANEYYNKKDFYIDRIANAEVEFIVSTEAFINFFSVKFFGGEKNEVNRAKIKEKYIEGYKARIASIEGKYKEQYIDNWLYDFAYYCGVVEVSPETEIEMPMAPFTQMSNNEIDETNPNYRKGYLDGLRTGNLIKTGIIKPSDAALATVSGDNYNRGFEDGQERGKKEGMNAAGSPLENGPLIVPSYKEMRNSPIKKELEEEYIRDNGGDDGMNGDYEDAYLKAYYATYNETRDYEYGRLLGYRRGAQGGEAMFISDPETGVLVNDVDVFFKGFDAGRAIGASGLPPEALYKEIKKVTGSYGEDYANILKKTTSRQLDGGQSGAGSGAGSDSPIKTPLEVLEELLSGNSEDFYLDELLLLDMFYDLERKIEEVQYYIQDDLEEIEYNRSLAGLSSPSELKADLEKLAKLENSLENDDLEEGEKASLDVQILVLKAEIAEQKNKENKVSKNWQEAEAAAKKKIDSIRLLMKDKLDFDTPLESNKDILTYIKINLESSKGNEEATYKDIDIFHDLSLAGVFDYKESRDVDVSILGSANFHLDHYAENMHIENADVLMKENGFEFKARGLSYVRSDYELTFMSGTMVIPSIEGGAHMGERYRYNFDDFKVHLSEGVKAQIYDQKDKLQGGAS